MTLVRKYVARPLIIEAVMLRFGNLEEALDWMGGDSYSFAGQEDGKVYINIDTLEGTMTAHQDDYIVKGTHGEFYPVRNDIFNHKYEEYEE